MRFHSDVRVQVDSEVSSRLVLIIYSVSQKKTSPTFLAVTRESIVGFS